MTTIDTYGEELRDMLRGVDGPTSVCIVVGRDIRLTLDEHEFVLHRLSTEWSCEHRTPPCGPLGISRWTRCSGSWTSMLTLVRRVAAPDDVLPEPVSLDDAWLTTKLELRAGWGFGIDRPGKYIYLRNRTHEYRVRHHGPGKWEMTHAPAGSPERPSARRYAWKTVIEALQDLTMDWT